MCIINVLWEVACTSGVQWIARRSWGAYAAGLDYCAVPRCLGSGPRLCSPCLPRPIERLDGRLPSAVSRGITTSALHSLVMEWGAAALPILVSVGHSCRVSRAKAFRLSQMKHLRRIKQSLYRSRIPGEEEGLTF
jgi:hypothetical protein